jgi:hypothetical protein
VRFGVGSTEALESLPARVGVVGPKRARRLQDKPDEVVQNAVATSESIPVRSVGNSWETKNLGHERCSRGFGGDGPVLNAAAMLTDTERSGPGNLLVPRQNRSAERIRSRIDKARSITMMNWNPRSRTSIRWKYDQLMWGKLRGLWKGQILR